MCPVVIGHGNGRDSFHDQERRGSRFELRLDLANINLYSTTDYNDTSQHKCSPVWSSCLAGHNIMRHAALGNNVMRSDLMIRNDWKLILLIVEFFWHSKHSLRFTQLPQHTLKSGEIRCNDFDYSTIGSMILIALWILIVGM